MLPMLICVQSWEKFDQYIEAFIGEHSLHPASVYKIYPEKTILGIDQVRDVSQIAQQAHSPILIAFYDFHTAKEESQNALLKTLEENNENVTFMLAVHDDSDVLPTIRSRTQVIRLEDTRTAPEELLKKYGIFDPSMNLEKWMGITTGVIRDDAAGLLIEVITYLQKQIHTKNESRPYTPAISELLEVHRVLVNNNVNYEYSLDAAGRVLNDHGLLPLPH